MGGVFQVQSWIAGSVVLAFSLTAFAAPSEAIGVGFWLLMLYSVAGPLAIIGQEKYGAQLTLFVVFWTLLLGAMGDESARLLRADHQSGDATAIFLVPAMLMPFAIVLSLILHASTRRGSNGPDAPSDKPSLSERLEKDAARRATPDPSNP